MTSTGQVSARQVPPSLDRCLEGLWAQIRLIPASQGRRAAQLEWDISPTGWDGDPCEAMRLAPLEG